MSSCITVTKDDVLNAISECHWAGPVINGVQIGNSDVEKECLRIGDRLAQYVELVIKWNEKVRIVGTRDYITLIYRHVLEAVVCGLALREDLFHVKQLPGEAFDIVDVGSGAGLPGIPIAMVCPDVMVYLVEPNFKKSTVLKELARKLKLTNAEIVVGKFPDVHWQPQSTLSVVITKATGLDSVIVNSLLSLPYSRSSALLMATADSISGTKDACRDKFLVWQHFPYNIPPDMSEREFLLVSRETDR